MPRHWTAVQEMTGENYTRNEWRRCENYTRNELRRYETTLEKSVFLGKELKVDSDMFRLQSLIDANLNEFKVKKSTPETSVKDLKLHSKIVKKK